MQDENSFFAVFNTFLLHLADDAGQEFRIKTVFLSLKKNQIGSDENLK